MVDNAKQIKKLNAAAKKKANERGKKEQIELNSQTKQETLFKIE